MSYTKVATSKTPALIIYLLDVSGSMEAQLRNGDKRITVVTENLRAVAIKMVQRSTKGAIVAPRYRIAMYAYSTTVQDILGGIKTIEELAKLGVPQLMGQQMTDTAAAFSAAERLLQTEAPSLQDTPAPLICHLTDGEYNGANPRQIVDRIRQMAFPDGNVLVENIFMTDDALVEPVTNAKEWTGLTDASQLKTQYAREMFEMSSPIPDSYMSIMREYGYDKLDSQARMMFPGDTREVVELGFAMSGATPIQPPSA